MRGYGQYCPIARGAEIFAERWTPIIVRNLLLGCETFTEIQRGAPGIPRSLLTQRLALLERHGLIERRPLPRGRGYRYLPTEAGKELWNVCVALGEWGARWLEVAAEHLDPYIALWPMCNSLAADGIPDRRPVIRFDFAGQPKKKSRFWLRIEHRWGEVCATCPGDEDLVISTDPERFVRWHMGAPQLGGGDGRRRHPNRRTPAARPGVSPLEQPQPLRPRGAARRARTRLTPDGRQPAQPPSRADGGFHSPEHLGDVGR